jgi:hypothetical protein
MGRSYVSVALQSESNLCRTFSMPGIGSTARPRRSTSMCRQHSTNILYLQTTDTEFTPSTLVKLMTGVLLLVGLHCGCMCSNPFNRVRTRAMVQISSLRENLLNTHFHDDLFLRNPVDGEPLVTSAFFNTPSFRCPRSPNFWIRSVARAKITHFA